MTEPLGEDEDFECTRCGDEISCCHMDGVPPEQRLCDTCTHEALVECRATLERVKTLPAQWREYARRGAHDSEGETFDLGAAAARRADALDLEAALADPADAIERKAADHETQ